MIITILLILLAIAGFFLAAHLLEWEAIDDWRERIWGEWSSRLMIGSLGLQAATFLPLDQMIALLGVVQPTIATTELRIIAGVLLLAAWFAKYVKQTGLRKKIAEKQGIING